MFSMSSLGRGTLIFRDWSTFAFSIERFSQLLAACFMHYINQNIDTSLSSPLPSLQFQCSNIQDGTLTSGELMKIYLTAKLSWLRIGRGAFHIPLYCPARTIRCFGPLLNLQDQDDWCWKVASVFAHMRWSYLYSSLLSLPSFCTWR